MVGTKYNPIVLFHNITLSHSLKKIMHDAAVQMGHIIMVSDISTR